MPPGAFPGRCHRRRLNAKRSARPRNKAQVWLDGWERLSYFAVYRHGFARVGEGEASAPPDRHLTGGPLSRSSGTESPERASASAKAFSGFLRAPGGKFVTPGS